jgi:hypothetical protein
MMHACSMLANVVMIVTKKNVKMIEDLILRLCSQAQVNSTTKENIEMTYGVV